MDMMVRPPDGFLKEVFLKEGRKDKRDRGDGDHNRSRSGSLGFRRSEFS